MSKIKEKIGICVGCEEPTPTHELSPEGYCPECSKKLMEEYYEAIYREQVARRNNAQADMLNRMYAHYF